MIKMCNHSELLSKIQELAAQYKMPSESVYLNCAPSEDQNGELNRIYQNQLKITLAPPQPQCSHHRKH
ncbi:unnamed protein product [Heterobilharzia americana]|nr:unnamed protein product [Heterobilharzia americana]